MFSSISTMIWGEEEEALAPTASLPPRSESPAGEDWVVVGPGPGPAPGDLSALEPLRTPSITPLSSTSPSSPASEAGEEALTRRTTGAGMGSGTGELVAWRDFIGEQVHPREEKRERRGNACRLDNWATHR